MINIKIKNQNGRSMIEMLGVLAIIGVLSVGGIAGYSKAMMKYRVNKTIEQLSLVSQYVRTFFVNQKDYIGATCTGNGNDGSGCQVIQKAKLIPDEMLTITDGKISAVTNSFGQSFEILTASANTEGDMKAAIVDVTIPSDACIEIATQDWTTIDGLIAVGVGSSGGLDVDLWSGGNIDRGFSGCLGGKFKADDDYIIACPGGANISVPIPLDLATEICGSMDYPSIYIKFK